MKKIISIALVVVLAVSMLATFAACGTKQETEKPADTKTTLVMATNAKFPPYEFYGDDGNLTGIDVEIAGKIAEKLGMKLEIVDVEFDTIIAGVAGINGEAKYDIGMAGMTITEERKKSVNFSETYQTAKQVVIVKADSKIVDPKEDIKSDGSMKIGVQLGTTGDIYAVDAYGKDNVVEFESGADAVQALVNDKVQAVIIDNEPAKNYVKTIDGTKILDVAFEDEKYAICVNKNNSELLEKINAALAELKADGTLQSIIDKYIKAE
ncbi:MAG: transporter substrate-binding domain-containing protein [Clostridia bacterium]|nr:transporter substrate-binding domain-containing protein [Clostridia bacterium]